MIDLKTFRKNAAMHDACDIYSERWDLCGSKKELYELACESECAAYIQKAVHEGWGISPEYIWDKFRPFINGKLKPVLENSRGGKYSSSIWCRCSGSLRADTTIVSIYESECIVFVPDAHVCKILIDDKSRVAVFLEGTGRAIVETYNHDIEFPESKDCRVKKL